MYTKKAIKYKISRLMHSHTFPTENNEGKNKEELVPILYLRTLISSFQNRNKFKDIEKFCLFLGYPRSGHSLVGSLLDAHPDAIISHEADVLGLIQYGIFNQNQIFSLILENSKAFAKMGRGWTGYSYATSNQWQGRFRTLKVIGDKRGGGGTRRLGDNPQLFDILNQKIGVKIKYIHHIRNPYDIISTMERWHKSDRATQRYVNYYFSFCQRNEKLKKKISPEDYFERRHELLISQPDEYIKRLCQFLELEYSEDYLKSCAEIIYESPHKSRYNIHWDAEILDEVQRNIEKHDFLKGYTFDD